MTPPSLDGLLTRAQLENISSDQFVQVDNCSKVRDHDAAQRALATWALNWLMTERRAFYERTGVSPSGEYLKSDRIYQHAQAALAKVKGT